MSPQASSHPPLTQEEMQALLAVTRALAAPFDLPTMLQTVAAAARQVLHAERSSIWLLDTEAGELVLEVSKDLSQVRLAVGAGLVGACARDRCLINVPDCYADPRFNSEVDKRSGFHTHCSLTLPLIDHAGQLVGVMQVLNRTDGVFEAEDEALAQALAAQCAMALSRVRMTAAMLEGERMRQELELARAVQLSTLPGTLPQISGYDMHGTFLPASLTGGDTYDIALIEQGLLLVLGDATGHGIAPALSVTQMHAMLRMAFSMGADLELAFRKVNDQLAATLADSRFVTAFIGLLDPDQHRLRFLSGGQGPILHFQAATGACISYKATSFPMGAMPITSLRPPVQIELAPGDMLCLLTDGIYEYEAPDGEQFGRLRVEQLLARHCDASAEQLSALILAAVRAFARGAAQEDDITMLLLKRAAATPGH
ncbi:SpoIIE family protein phosphatase [Paucibacter sp. B2R-40]|uniref:PP2C family protein-serine/threonine phosphatase n=1 Tax=Paucibacter sp. B2R-40 TaxID=2893554 RepID=UPI0021E44287|nr:GAF domain-containing SpoIIE family protein phosphatase [Paucibacter sp. B2R-40]MCV2354606.1 SpoIIE family protein phosphatase [Paucibacter sp. B2R-40]